MLLGDRLRIQSMGFKERVDKKEGGQPSLGHCRGCAVCGGEIRTSTTPLGKPLISTVPNSPGQRPEQGRLMNRTQRA